MKTDVDVEIKSFLVPGTHSLQKGNRYIKGILSQKAFKTHQCVLFLEVKQQTKSHSR